MSRHFVGPPLLKDFLCEVKVNKSSKENDCSSTVFLQFNIDESSKSSSVSTSKSVSMELDPNALDALLEGLHRIQNQLSNVANKQA